MHCFIHMCSILNYNIKHVFCKMCVGWWSVVFKSKTKCIIQNSREICVLARRVGINDRVLVDYVIVRVHLSVS